MKNAAINTMASGIVFLLFFNSTEVYSKQPFDTLCKAKNYAKKYGYTLHESLPENIDAFVNID